MNLLSRSTTLAEFSLKRPVTTVMFFISMVVFGLVATRLLRLEFFPAIDFPFVGVQIAYPNSTPEEVERGITRPLEESLSTIPGIDQIFSTSNADGTFIGMLFDWGKTADVKGSEVRDRIDAVRSELPSDVQRINLLKFSSADEPLLRLRLSSSLGDLSDDYELLTRKLKRPLERIPGVARVELAGVEPYEVRIDLLPERIAAHGVDLGKLAMQLRTINFSTSAGLISDNNIRYRVQPQGELLNLDELGAIEVGTSGVRLRDIAEIKKQPQRMDYRRILNGKLAVGVDVFKERNANLVDVGRAAMAEVEAVIASGALQGIELIVIDDQAEGVSTSLAELSESGWIGMALSVLVLYFFLRHWPSTLMVTLAVPICVSMTLGCMYFVGQTLNILSMMGLLLGIGMLVDNAVVVVESIYQQREKTPNDPVGSAIKGTKFVSLAVSAGTLTGIIVFLPNIFGKGNQISLFLYHVAVPLTISHLCSWLVAVSLIPMMAARVRPPKGVQGVRIVETWKRQYAGLVRWMLGSRKTTIWIIVGVLLSTGIPMMAGRFDMFPRDETRDLRAQFEMNGSYSLPEMEETARQFQDYLMANKARFEIDQVYSYLAEGQGINVWVRLMDDKHSKRATGEILDEMRKDMPKFAIGQPNFDAQGGPGGGGGGSSDSGVSLRVTGDSDEQLLPLARTVVNVLRNVKGLTDVRIDTGTENKEIRVRVDRDRAAALGFSTDQVAQVIAVALRGTPLREFRTPDGEVPTWLRFKDAEKLSMDSLQQVRMTRPDGTSVPLSALVTLETATAAREISREQRRTGMTIKANLDKEATKLGVQPLIDTALKGVVFPAGYGFDYGQSFDDEAEAGNDMLVNTLLAMVMIFVVMAALFESLVYPLAILSGVFFSFTGVLWGFMLTGTTFSIMAMIGVLVLIGVVVNNGIVLVEHVNNLRREGMTRSEALILAGSERLRPILITTGTTFLGLLPLCFSQVQVGGDGPPYYPMARAIASGLLFSTFITLLVLPTIYAMLDDASISMKRWANRTWMRAGGKAKVEVAA